MSVFVAGRRSSAVAMTNTLLVLTTIESYDVCVCEYACECVCVCVCVHINFVCMSGSEDTKDTRGTNNTKHT